MAKKILFTASLMLAFLTASAAAQLNIGYMSTNDVLMQLPKTQEIQQELNQLIQEKQAELQERATAFQDAVADYQANQASMTPAEITQAEEELQQMNRELTEFNQSIKIEIQQRRNELLLPVLEAIDAAIAEVAEAKNLDFVLNKTTNTGANIIFYASQTQENITEEVLEKVKTTIE